MKIFISHQKVDSILATNISDYLKENHQLDSYLDLIDPNVSQMGDQLGEYLRNEMGKCTQLMAVVSENTKGSWWVPWEIGVATEKDHPIATFAGDNAELPTYLKKWPYLKTYYDLDAYAKASIAAKNQFTHRRNAFDSISSAQRSSTQEYYRNLRASLGQ